MFSGGMSPARWRVDLDFGNLTDTDGQPVTTTNVRRVRWTWAADLQFGRLRAQRVRGGDVELAGERNEYWHRVAGPGAGGSRTTRRRSSIAGTWTEERGNYSGGSIRHTQTSGAQVRCTYSAAARTSLYLGTRYCESRRHAHGPGGWRRADDVDLKRALEDVLIRVSAGRVLWRRPAHGHGDARGIDGRGRVFRFPRDRGPDGGLAGLRGDADRRRWRPTGTPTTRWRSRRSERHG